MKTHINCQSCGIPLKRDAVGAVEKMTGNRVSNPRVSNPINIKFTHRRKCPTNMAGNR